MGGAGLVGLSRCPTSRAPCSHQLPARVLPAARHAARVDDYLLFMSEAAKRNPKIASLPQFLFGHSNGGLVAAHTAVREPQRFAGLIVHSGAMDIPWTPVLKWVAVLVAELNHAVATRGTSMMPAQRSAQLQNALAAHSVLTLGAL